MGWALSKLAIPETFPALLKRAEYVVKTSLEARGINGDEKQISHFFELFARAKYRESEKLMRSLIDDKQHFEPVTRAAAIWALGFFYVDNPEPTLVKALIGRVNDQGSIPPEAVEIHEMSTVSLGRMKAKDAVRHFRKHWDGRAPQDRFAFSMAWAVQEITGEKTARPEPLRAFATGFNLEPLPKPGAN